MVDDGKMHGEQTESKQTSFKLEKVVYKEHNIWHYKNVNKIGDNHKKFTMERHETDVKFLYVALRSIKF